MLQIGLHYLKMRLISYQMWTRWVLIHICPAHWPILLTNPDPFSHLRQLITLALWKRIHTSSSLLTCEMWTPLATVALPSCWIEILVFDFGSSKHRIWSKQGGYGARYVRLKGTTSSQYTSTIVSSSTLSSSPERASISLNKDCVARNVIPGSVAGPA